MIEELPIKSSLLNVMARAVHKASRKLLRDFNEVENLQISKKGACDFVTEADIRTEKILYDELSKARPDFGFLMEEGGEIEGKSDFYWVIDPLDGTTNFIHAVPYFSVSIAVEKRTKNGRYIITALTYDPIHDELFIAEKGKGAYSNMRRLKVTKRETDFYFATGSTRNKCEYLEKSSIITKKAQSLDSVIRRNGAVTLDLAYVAAGRYDACWFPHVKRWDMAAGILMIKEAGGVVTSMDDIKDAYESGSIVVSSQEAAKFLQ